MNKKLISFLGIISLALALYVNYLAGVGKVNNISTGEVSAIYPNLFTPAGFTFSIWGIIYLFNIGFIVFQIYKAFNKPKNFNSRLNQYFILINLVNLSWIYAWHYQILPLTIVLMTAFLILLILSFKESGVYKDGVAEYFLENVTFSIYLGWISVATIANFTIYLVSLGLTQFSEFAGIISAIMIAIAVILAEFMLLSKKNLVYQFVIIWALYGIYSARSVEMYDGSQTVAMASIIGIIIISLIFLASRFLTLTVSKKS